jgi:DNA-binding beta-propeller fold protein YncE
MRNNRASALAGVLLAAPLLAACSGTSPGPPGSTVSPVRSAAGAPTYLGGSGISKTLPGCTTAVQTARELPASDVTLQRTTQAPFGVAISADGRWGFYAAGQDVGVLRIGADGAPMLVRTISGDAGHAGMTLTHDGTYLLVADEANGAEVISTTAAEAGGKDAVLGTLAAPSGQGAIEVAVTPDGRFAFVSLEDSDLIAVFSLRRTLTAGFSQAYIGAIPTKEAPVGLAVSPDGKWLYSTSEAMNPRTQVGSLAVVSVARAETDPARSVVATVPAGCNPVRVVVSADGRVIWVTARASDALLAYSARALRTDPARALLARVQVGELPVGLALAKAGSLIVVADSDRFLIPGQHASLAIIDVADALDGRHALLGYLTAGRFPRDVATSPTGQVVLVANYASGQIEAVSVRNLP